MSVTSAIFMSFVVSSSAAAFIPSPTITRVVTASQPASRIGKALHATIAEPRTRPKPQIEVLVVEEPAADTALESGWNLILWNDSFNSRHHVARTLCAVCALSDDRAYVVMMEAHMSGTAVVGEYTKETAEQYAQGLHAAGINATIEKAEPPE